MASVTAAQAGNTTVTNTRTPFDFAEFVPCANGGLGEVVDVTADIHQLTRVTINGNHLGVTAHSNSHGVGTGQTTGDTYQGGGETTDTFNLNPNNLQQEATFVSSFRLNGQGSAPNLTLRVVEHFTVNANGDVTVLVDNFSIDCG